MLERGAAKLVRGAVGWPVELDDLDDAPSALHVAGALPDLSRAVAIVGTRRATGAALTWTRELARALAREGCVVVSGGALGIDASAHEGALAAGGKTVAVLASGLDRPYPDRHRGLFRDIAASGAVVSEMELGTGALRPYFLLRNRIIAALSRGVLVVQAPLRSGALSTAAHARALERPLLAVPWALDDPWGEGCVELLARGARVCRGIGDVLEAALGERPARRRTRRGRARDALDPQQQAVFDAMRGGAASVDELVAASGLRPAEVQAVLLALTLLGAAEEPSPGTWRPGTVRTSANNS